MPTKGSSIVEVGYAVQDMDDAIRFFTESMAAGPFAVFKHVKMQRAVYRGTPVDVDIDIALGASGDLVIELIKQHNQVASPFCLLPGDGAMSMNHWSVFTTDFDRELQEYRESGIEVAFYAEFPQDDADGFARVAYLDTIQRAGAYLELMESDPPVLVDLYQQIIESGRS